MEFLFQAQGHVYRFHTEVGDHPVEIHVDQVDQPPPAPTSIEPEDTEA